MTHDPRTALLAAATGDDGPGTALIVLRHALAWSAQAVASARGSSADAALDLVVALDDALTQVDQLLEQVPALAQSAMAGVSLTDYLRTQCERLAEIAERVAVIRAEHEALAAVEAELRATGAEHERVQRELEDLRRLRRLVDALPEIRDQHAGLTRRLAAMTSPVAEAEQALAATAARVVTLSAERLADLGDRTRDLLEQLRESETAWAELRDRAADDTEALRARDAEYQKLLGERQTRVAALRSHAAIDADLADRLSAIPEGTLPERVRSLLADAQKVIDEVDIALGDALARYNQLVDEHSKVLPWRDES